jgi:sucrose phosphorylase
MPGVPGIYFHSLVGSRNYFEGVKLTGVNRSINREKFNYKILVKKLTTDGKIEKVIFSAYKKLISIRTSEKSFNPFGKFEFLDLGPTIFAILQYSRDEQESILALHNFSDKSVEVTLPEMINTEVRDLILDTPYTLPNTITLEAYQVMWLKSIKG